MASAGASSGSCPMSVERLEEFPLPRVPQGQSMIEADNLAFLSTVQAIIAAESVSVRLASVDSEVAAEIVCRNERAGRSVHGVRPATVYTALSTVDFACETRKDLDRDELRSALLDTMLKAVEDGDDVFQGEWTNHKGLQSVRIHYKALRDDDESSDPGDDEGSWAIEAEEASGPATPRRSIGSPSDR